MVVKYPFAFKCVSSLRVCNKCKRELPISDFYTVVSGIRYICKRCERVYWATYRKTHHELKAEYEEEYAWKNLRRRWAIACLAGHRRRGYATEITSKELYQIALNTEACFICETRLDWQLGNKGNIRDDSPTLDRLDNEDVIRRDIVTILCYKCNATKRDRTMKEFLLYCNAVVAKFHSHFEYPHDVHL